MLSQKLLTHDQREAWEALCLRSRIATFFQTPQWIFLWQKHFQMHLNIIGIYEEETLVGVAPLIQQNNVFQFAGVAPVLGNELVSDYGDIVIEEGREKQVWESVLNQGKMELNFIREDSSSLEILEGCGGVMEEVDVAPHLCLAKTWDEYLGSLDRHDRHELRRKMRKIEAEGITFEQHTEKDSFEVFLSLMASSSEDKKKFLTDKMKDYFRDIYKTYFPTGMLKIYYLKKDNQAIAAVMLFLWKGDMLLYNSGFDQSFRHIAPGLVLNGFVIKTAIEEKRVCYDFLRGNERYKYDLGGKDRKLYRIRFNGRTTL